MEEKFNLWQSLKGVKPYLIRTMVERPCCHLVVNWLVILLMAAVVVGADLLQIHELQFNDFLILQEKDVQNFFAHSDAQRVAAEASQGEISFRSEASFVLGGFHLYQSDDLFSPRNIQAICETERVFVSGDSYPLFCQTLQADGADTKCLPQLAAVSSFYYNFTLDECELLEAPVIDAITQGLLVNPQVGPLLFNDLQNPTVARSTLVLGTPLGDDTPPFKNFSAPVSDFLDEEATEGHSVYMAEYEANLFEFFGVSNNPPFDYAWNRESFRAPGADMDIRIYGFLLDQAHLNEVLETDQVIVSASFFSVLLVVVLYVKSFFLAFTALISISMTMIVALFLYGAVLNINYFTTLHVVSFFIIMAIGANNFYVLSDAWKQSEQIIEREEEDTENEYLVKRMDYTYTRAALSVFNTAMTTFIAFVANLISPISIIAGFGLFSGIAVFVNFIFMLNVHPTHIMIHHKYARHWWFTTKPRDSTEEPQNIIEAADKEKQDVELIEKEAKKSSRFERMRDFYISLVLETPFPYVGVIVMFVLATVMISIAVRLETPTTVETIYPDSYMWTGFLEAFNGQFTEGSDDTFTEVFGVFGIQDLDTGNVKFLDANQFRGDVVFDADFDFSLEETQNKIIEYCELLPTVECFERGCTIDRLVLERTILCTMQAFRDFHQTEFGSADSFVTRINGTPSGLSNADLIARVEQFLASDAGAPHAGNIGVLEGEVKFVATSFRQSMNVDQPLIVKEPVLEIFDQVDAIVLQDAPPGTTTFFTTSFDIVWTYTEIGLVTGLFVGMAVSLGASYFIVLFGTRHILVSAYAILGVAFIVSCVLGTVQRLGFELGVTEAIAGVMVIGLAVDYIVHLGYMFMAGRQRRISYSSDAKKDTLEAGDITNDDMIRYSVEKMMFTILAGGFTTFAAGIVLFACTLSFFFKMGVLIMFTALYSVLFAFIYFIPMLKIFGPGKR